MIAAQDRIESLLKPSKAGRIGFLLSLLSLFGACFSFGLFIYVLANEPRLGGRLDTLGILLFFVFFLVSLAGLVVSLVGALGRRGKKGLAIAGIVISLTSAIVLGFPVILWLGEML